MALSWEERCLGWILSDDVGRRYIFTFVGCRDVMFGGLLRFDSALIQLLPDH